MKQVRETKAGQSISAVVVLNKKGQLVAKVHAYFADSGGVTVNVFQVGDGPIERSLKAAGYDIDNVPDRDTYMDRFYRPMALQTGKADGGGYDKYAAALSGLYIDGYRMADHCGQDDRTRRLYKRYRKAFDACSTEADARAVNKEFELKARKLGGVFANIQMVTTEGKELKGYRFQDGRFGEVLREEWEAFFSNDYPEPKEYKGEILPRWGSLFLVSGLDRLQAMGYNVIQAI